MCGVTSALKSVVEVIQKVSKANYSEKNQKILKKRSEPLSCNMGPVESQQNTTNGMKGSASSSKDMMTSFCQVLIAYKIYTSVLENSPCRRSGDRSFFDAKRTRYLY